MNVAEVVSSGSIDTSNYKMMFFYCIITLFACPPHATNMTEKSILIEVLYTNCLKF